MTDYYRGDDLYDLIVSGKWEFDEDETKHIMRQLMTAVCVCHANGIMHRDIKPENIMLHRPEFNRPPRTPGLPYGRERRYGSR